MKDFRLGKYLISFSIASGSSLSDKYFAEYSQHLKVGGVYTKKYFCFEKRQYLTDNDVVYWVIIWCFLIGVSKLNINKEK